MKKALLYLCALWAVSASAKLPYTDQGHYYCTVSDNYHFELLANLIGSIHKHDFEKLTEILVIDIGMEDVHREYLARVQKLRVIPVEKVHPDLCTYFNTRADGKFVRGWYAWKPVAIKQALDEFPYMLYIDAGATVIGSMEPLFNHIREHGYFLMDGGDTMASYVTQPVIEHFKKTLPLHQVDHLLHPATRHISAGLQGMSRELLEPYILPMYRFAHDLSLFADDGTALKGFGYARHDQNLFSIMVQLNQLYIHPKGCNFLRVNNCNVPFYIICCCNKNHQEEASIYQSRWDNRHYERFIHFIR